jgi:hypothetical protein
MRKPIVAAGIAILSSLAIMGLVAALASPQQVRQMRSKADRAFRDPCPGPQIVITTSSPLPPGKVGGDYYAKIETEGGVPPVKFGQYQSDPATGVIKAFMPDSFDSIGPYLAAQKNLYSGDADLYYFAGLRPGYSGPPVSPWNSANIYNKLDGLYIRSSTGEIFGQPKLSGHFEILIVALDKCTRLPTADWRTWKYLHLEITE